MIWADRAAIGAAALTFIILMGLAAFIGQMPDAGWIWPVTRIVAVVGVVTWGVCRTVDFVFGGPQRRRNSSN